jgi:hypothetical protein
MTIEGSGSHPGGEADPDNASAEEFLGICDEVTKRLSEARDSAREKRMQESRAEGCGKCVGDTASRRRYFDGRGPKCCDTQLPAVAGRIHRSPSPKTPRNRGQFSAYMCLRCGSLCLDVLHGGPREIRTSDSGLRRSVKPGRELVFRDSRRWLASR